MSGRGVGLTRYGDAAVVGCVLYLDETRVRDGSRR